MKMNFWKVPNIFIKEKFLKKNLGFRNFTKPNYRRYFTISAKSSAKEHFYKSIMGLRNYGEQNFKWAKNWRFENLVDVKWDKMS